MENDFIPGNTPQGSCAALHRLFLLLSSFPYCHSLLPQNRPQTSFFFCSVSRLCQWQIPLRMLQPRSESVYTNKCVMRFCWHYPTQSDNDVTFLTTLCILLEGSALCQDAQACSSQPSTMSTHKIPPYTNTESGWSQGVVYLKPLCREIGRIQSWENTFVFRELFC